MTDPKVNMTDAEALEAYRKHQAYMAKYNKRPYVKAKRTAYNKARWARIKAVKDLLGDESK
jgi:hypothetical protein